MILSVAQACFYKASRDTQTKQNVKSFVGCFTTVWIKFSFIKEICSIFIICAATLKTQRAKNENENCTPAHKVHGSFRSFIYSLHDVHFVSYISISKFNYICIGAFVAHSFRTRNFKQNFAINWIQSFPYKKLLSIAYFMILWMKVTKEK